MSKKIIVIYLVVFGAILTAAAAVSVTAELGPVPQNTNSSTTNAPEEIASAQVDLSGTYTGNIKLTGSHEMSGEGTINMKGEAPTMSSKVTIEVGGMTHNGRFSAVTTRGYTGVTMYFPDIEDSATKTGLVVMARAKKKGDRLTLTPVPNARNTISFK
ncbi:MAG: hypothetical protein H7Z16_02495 [Pyrinomonadaceae bacterium]|nr:hypothetical protein [Pyrinomonadaceae bacterium]